MMPTSSRKPGSAENHPQKRRLGLAEKIIIGLGLGVAAGLFFGEKVDFLTVAGDAFIMLLQVTAIPYIMVSLITALGRLTLNEAKLLGLKAGSILLLLWGIGLVVVLLAPLAFPQWPSASFFSTTKVEEAKPIDFLQLYIPANPFFSLANAVVPSIVVFSILIGLALTSVKDKEALLGPLSAVAEALMRVTKFITELAPYGIFALTASAAGTIDFESLTRLQVYVVTYMALALILCLWVLPALVAVVTPLRYGDILRVFRGPAITAIAACNVLIILPVLAEGSKQLIAASQREKDEPEEWGAQSSVDVIIPAAFNFPHLGNIMSLMFVLFAGWYIGTAVPVSKYLELSAAGLASLFGGTLLALPFMLDLLQLPQDLFQMFLTLDVVGRRFGSLLAAMNIITVALIGSFALQGRLRLRLLPLARFIGVTALLLAVTLLGIRVFYTYVVVAPFTKAEALKVFQPLATPQPAKVYTKLPPGIGQGSGRPANLAQIKARGVLRVCYLPYDFPSAYFNNADPPQLVGFDIEMAHRFARSLGLPLEFLPVTNEIEAEKLLNNGSCDIFMSALPISLRSAERFAMSAPIYTSSVGLIVKDSRRNQFQTWEDIRNLGAAFRVAIPDTPNFQTLAKDLMKDATLIPFRDKEALKELLESGAPDVDAIATLSEEGATWTLLYPDFSLVVPKPTVFSPVAYAFALDNKNFLRAFDGWLVAEKSRGTTEELYRHWMLGEAVKKQKPPRWSVIRNVLHWVN